MAWSFVSIQGRYWLEFLGSVLAFGGVLFGVLWAFRSASRDRAETSASGEADRQLQLRAQVRSAMLGRLDSIRSDITKTLTDRQRLFARLTADANVLVAIQMIVEAMADDREQRLPSPEALKPPTITEDSRVFAGEALMGQLQVCWRWWHSYSGLEDDVSKGRTEKRDALDVLTGPFRQSVDDLLPLFNDRIDLQRPSNDKLIDLLGDVDAAETTVLDVATDPDDMVTTVSDVSTAARSALLGQVTAMGGE